MTWNAGAFPDLLDVRSGRQNTEAEQKACEIRLRAERRAGQMIAEMEKAKGAAEAGTNRGATPSQAGSASSKPLADLGISHNQSSRWQKLAAIPEAESATFGRRIEGVTNASALLPLAVSQLMRRQFCLAEAMTRSEIGCTAI